MAELIAILNEDGEQILTTMVNIGCSVSVSKEFAQHSLENRQVIIDDQYDNPTIVNLQFILSPSDYVAVYNEIKQYFNNITSFIIQTKVDTYKNMFLRTIPHEETPDMFNTISINLEFTQQLITESDTSKIVSASNQSDVSTVNAGNKSKTEDDGTVLQRTFNKIANVLNGD